MLEPNLVIALLSEETWEVMIAMSASTVAASRLKGDADTEMARARAAKPAENFMMVIWETAFKDRRTAWMADILRVYLYRPSQSDPESS